MSDTHKVSPYGSARDLPSVKEMEQQIAAFKLLGLLLPKAQRKQLKNLQSGRLTWAWRSPSRPTSTHLGGNSSRSGSEVAK